MEGGPEGLYDLTRANHQVAQRIPPELERTILSIRRRLQVAFDGQAATGVSHNGPGDTVFCTAPAAATTPPLSSCGITPWGGCFRI